MVKKTLVVVIVSLMGLLSALLATNVTRALANAPSMTKKAALKCSSSAMFHSAVSTAAPPDANHVILSGSTVPSLRNVLADGILDANQQLSLEVWLKPRNADQLSSLICGQRDPSSHDFRHFLTPQQYMAQFGPLPSTVSLVEKSLSSQGLHVDGTSSNGLRVDIHGSVSEIEHAFDMTIQTFPYGGRQVFAPSNDPSIPINIKDDVLSIVGLNDVAQLHPYTDSKHSVSEDASALRSATASGCPGNLNGSTPSQISTMFDLQPLLNNGDLGSNMSVALIELASYLPSDLATFQSCFAANATNKVTVKAVGGGSLGIQPGTQGVGETELDMEVLSSLAPKTNINIYVIPTGSTSDSVLQNAIQDAINDGNQIVSISLGDCETDYGESLMKSTDATIQQGLSQGTIIIAATGDSGPIGNPNVPTCNNQLVNFPASDPNVIAVGGTMESSQNQLWVWQYYPGSPGGGFSGEPTTYSGDYPTSVAPPPLYCNSFYFFQPSWQTGLGVITPQGNPDYNPCDARLIPDVAADANGAYEYCTVGDCATKSGENGWFVLGGTSEAAPIWAAILADASQYLNSTIDFSAVWSGSLIYSMFNNENTITYPYTPYYDVTAGESTYNNIVYQATAGYDLTTGVGAPDAWDIARDVANLYGYTPPPPAQGSFNCTPQADIASSYDYGNSTTGIWVWPGSSSTYLGTPTMPWKSGTGSWNAANSTFVTGDFNGDGCTDLAGIYNYGGGTTGIWIWPGTANGYLGSPTLVWKSNTGSFDWTKAKWVAGDFNGDGKTDLLATYNYGSSTTGFWIWPGASSGYLGTEFLAWKSGAGTFDWTKTQWVAGDFNGDGRADLASIYDDGNSTTTIFIWPGATNSSYLGQELQEWKSGAGNWNEANATWVAGDFNGDGKADLAGIYNYGSSTTGVWIWPGSSSSYLGGDVLAWKSGAGTFDWTKTKWVANDLNGDGKEDLVSMYDDGSSTTTMFVWPGANTSTYLGQELQEWKSDTGSWNWANAQLAP